MGRQSLAFLRELVNAPRPFGFPQPGQRLLRDHITSCADEVNPDVDFIPKQRLQMSRRKEMPA